MSEGLAEIQRLVMAQFRLDGMGPHGLPHWQAVYRNGMAIADADKRVNRRVVAAFAFLHDSQREDEWEDPMHGVRGADYVIQLRLEGKLDWLSADEELLLRAAVCDHSRGLLSDDPTIQACWDADRLDLPRIGVRPHPKFLGSIYGLTPGVIERHWDAAWAEDAL